MQGLSAQELLELSDALPGRHPVEQGLVMLGYARPELDRQGAETLGLGERDRLLLALRAATFGQGLALRSDCPECGEAHESEIGPVLAREAGRPAPTVIEVEAGGEAYRLRPPNSADLLHLAAPAIEDPVDLLLRACLIEPDEHDLDPEIAAALGGAMEAADPLADIVLAQDCTACSARWEEAFDLIGHFRAEIEAWASRLIVEVHLLARAYGWSENTILALPPRRRAAYLELAGG